TAHGPRYAVGSCSWIGFQCLTTIRQHLSKYLHVEGFSSYGHLLARGSTLINHLITDLVMRSNDSGRTHTRGGPTLGRLGHRDLDIGDFLGLIWT
ncbi:hypothetical protein AMTR_s00054p00206990, partial [Amborella trichopoda]